METLRRDLSSAFRSMGIIEARIGGRLTVVVGAVLAWSVFLDCGCSVDCDSLLEVEKGVVFGVVINCSKNTRKISGL